MHVPLRLGSCCPLVTPFLSTGLLIAYKSAKKAGFIGQISSNFIYTAEKKRIRCLGEKETSTEREGLSD